MAQFTCLLQNEQQIKILVEYEWNLSFGINSVQ